MKMDGTFSLYGLLIIVKGFTMPKFDVPGQKVKLLLKQYLKITVIKYQKNAVFVMVLSHDASNHNETKLYPILECIIILPKAFK